MPLFRSDSTLPQKGWLRDTFLRYVVFKGVVDVVVGRRDLHFSVRRVIHNRWKVKSTLM